MTLNNYWKKDKVFNLLCNVVSSGRLVCMTGAGVSVGLKRLSGENMPTWPGLLRDIMKGMECDFDDEKKKILNELLLDENPSAETLIEAATIMKNVNGDKFTEVFDGTIKHEEEGTTKTHELILDLYPRGILTYNYDFAHENALKKKKMSGWITLLPSEEEKLKNALKNRLKTPFLLKAHGSGDAETLTLTRDSYRDLFNKCPVYKAFVQHVFTNYNLLILGFGLSDPDFELLVNTVFSVYGSPIQEHVVIKHKEEKKPKDLVYYLRYGLHFLYVEKFEDIPLILADSIATLGTDIERIYNDCKEENPDKRSCAHHDIERLSIPGKVCLENVLKKEIKEIMINQDSLSAGQRDELSELVWALGIIAKYRSSAKEFIIEEIVNKSHYVEPVAHALITLKDTLKECDLSKAKEWEKRFEKHNLKVDDVNPDPDNRLPIYSRYIHVYLRAKYKNFN